MNEPVVSERESNISKLSSAMGNLSGAVNALESLKEGLRGDDVPDCAKDAIATLPTLNIIMLEWPERLNALSENIRKQISDIKEIL